MKISCKVIMDILPLYYDNVCSEESRALVDEHLEECASCREELNKISQEVRCPHLETDEASPMRQIASVWKKDRMKSFVKGTVIALVSCALIVGLYWGLTRWKVIPVSPDILEVTDVAQLSDGRIIYHLNVKDNKNLYFIKFTTNEDGSYYMTPMRSVFEDKRKTEHGLFNDYFMVDIDENNAYQQKHGDKIEITSCYIGPKDDGILIWEEGMELPPASEELEKMVRGS